MRTDSTGTVGTGEALWGELTFSAVLPVHGGLTLRSLNWYNRLSEVRAGIPFLFVHDFGLLLQSRPGSEIHVGLRLRSLSIAQDRIPHQDFAECRMLLKEYASFLDLISQTQLALSLRRQKTSDPIAIALLAHLFEGIHFHWPQGQRSSPIPLGPLKLENVEPAEHLTPQQAKDLVGVLSYLIRHKTQLLIAIEQVDLDVLRLLQMTQGSEVAGTFFLELHQMFASPMANDIANFSLDLLPSVLETKRSQGAQRYLVDGYASVENRGNLDSLLPSELVYDDELFDRRYLQKEQLYYAREKDRENKERLHVFLVDASASMRGLRTVFARGVALAMAKKALLAGDKVVWRFFDSRLHEKQELKNGNLRIPYLLCFKGERGRNTTEVFTALHRELARQKQKISNDVVVTFFTHSRCVVRSEVVLGLKNFARLFGFFVKPSHEEVYLEYLSQLDGHHVISADLLEDRTQRQDQALALLEGYEVGVKSSD